MKCLEALLLVCVGNRNDCEFHSQVVLGNISALSSVAYYVISQTLGGTYAPV